MFFCRRPDVYIRSSRSTINRILFWFLTTVVFLGQILILQRFEMHTITLRSRKNHQSQLIFIITSAVTNTFTFYHQSTAKQNNIVF